MLKSRIFSEHNYKGIHFNGKTMRIALDPLKPIKELSYPEFYDVKVTSYCKGNCPYCYQDSKETSNHVPDAIEKFKEYFGKLSENQKPFQIAFGGGEPTEYPLFMSLMEECYNLGITPNYTTNGMWTRHPTHIKEDILTATKLYCGGVAVSVHNHLRRYWKQATELYLENDIFTNLHVIISNKHTIDNFMAIYKQYHGRVKYFILLPLAAQGRSKDNNIDWEYMIKELPKHCPDIAFGANFYPYLCKTPGRFPVSLYEPELMSKYLDLETMNIYPSSFSNKIVELKGIKWKIK